MARYWSPADPTSHAGEPGKGDDGGDP
jgi:hypothetical protein